VGVGLRNTFLRIFIEKIHRSLDFHIFLIFSSNIFRNIKFVYFIKTFIDCLDLFIFISIN